MENYVSKFLNKVEGGADWINLAQIIQWLPLLKRHEMSSYIKVRPWTAF